MANTLTELKDRLERLEKQIHETRSRLPAHSTKPPIMMELLDLEDAAHDLQQKITALEKAPADPKQGSPEAK